MDKDKNTSRKRSINFQLIEIRTLVDLVLQYKSVIENKKSDAVTWQDKKSAWTGIANKFNATCGVQPRTAENLRLKYECLKKDLRKKAASKKKSMFLTGGGINVDIAEYVDFEKKLLEILTLSIQGLSSVGDSDEIEKRDVTTNHEAPVESLVHNIGSEDADNQLVDITPVTSIEYYSNKFFQLIESHHVEPIVEAVPSCSNTNNINAEQQQTTFKRKWSPHGLKSKKTGTLHVKKYNASVHDKFTKLAEDKTELVKLQFETQQAHLQFKHNQHKLKMEILQEKLKIKQNQNELLLKQNELVLKQIKEQDLKNTILLNQCTQD